MAVGNVGFAARLEKETSAMTQLKRFLSRYFYLCMSLVMAGLVVWGFSRTVDASLFHAKPARPLLLWMHGAAFSTWVLFFIAQSTLIRVRKVSVHRTLGWFGAGLATVMVVLGLTVAVVMTRFDMVVLHQRGVDSFLSIPFWDMLVFGTCIALAILWRKKPEYHRRLVFVATCQLMDAAIGRFDFWFNHSIFYVGLDLLIVLGVGARSGGRWPHSQGVSLCAARAGRRPEHYRVSVARQSRVVAGGYARDTRIVKEAGPCLCPANRS